MRRAIGFAGAPNEDIEELFAVAVNERGDRATLERYLRVLLAMRSRRP